MKLMVASYYKALTILREKTADVVFYPANESPWLYGDYALRLEGVGTAYVLCLPEHEDQLKKLPRLRKTPWNVFHDSISHRVGEYH